MNVQFRVIPIPDDRDIMHVVAAWSMSEWGDDFPDDSIDTYTDLYRQSQESRNGIPRVFIAMDQDEQPVGTITFIADDELPDATESGPWLAALYVLPDFRGHGVGRALVDCVIDHAGTHGHSNLYLYTSDQVSWYEGMGWTSLRHATLGNQRVTVMSYSL